MMMLFMFNNKVPKMRDGGRYNNNDTTVMMMTLCFLLVGLPFFHDNKQVSAFSIPNNTAKPIVRTKTNKSRIMPHRAGNHVKFLPNQQQHSVSSFSSSSSTTTTALFAGKKAGAAMTSVTSSSIVSSIWMKVVAMTTILTKSLSTVTQWHLWVPRQKVVLGVVFGLGVALGMKLNTSSIGGIQTKRFVNAVDIPSKYFGPNAPLLKGRAVSISDGDTFRFYHRPTPFHSTKLITKGPNKVKLSETTMPIRICTYDSPETPKFGKSGQPFGKEAKEKLEQMLGNNKTIIKLRLLQKDQYGRAVAQVFGTKQSKKGIDEIMLSEGLGEVYVGQGAVYGPLGKDKYLQIQENAQKQKVGMWSLGNKRESAAEYKRRTK